MKWFGIIILTRCLTLFALCGSFYVAPPCYLIFLSNNAVTWALFPYLYFQIVMSQLQCATLYENLPPFIQIIRTLRPFKVNGLRSWETIRIPVRPFKLNLDFYQRHLGIPDKTRTQWLMFDSQIVLNLFWSPLMYDKSGKSGKFGKSGKKRKSRILGIFGKFGRFAH